MESNGEPVDSGVGSRPVPKRTNVPGARTDVAWNHGTCIDGNSRKTRCNFCGHILNGSIYRLKHHLAGTKKDVAACTSVPDEVKKQMHDIVYGLQERLIKKTRRVEEEVTNDDDDTPRKGKEAETSGNIFRRTIQPTINSIVKKPLREEACLEIASFFYNNAIPFNVANSEEYGAMFEKVARHGFGFKPPSYHEFRVKYLKQKVEMTTLSLEEHKESWKKTGCTIMTDGWTDKRRRTILNFLVNSPKGTVFLKSVDASHISKTADKIFKMIDDVVEEIGEENVVQVVTDNVANYKAAGEMLMEKRKKLYWTPCAAHCIDLMWRTLKKNWSFTRRQFLRGERLQLISTQDPF